MSLNLSESEQALLNAFLGAGENNLLSNETVPDLGRFQGYRNSFKLTLDYVTLYFTPVIIFTGIAGNLVSIFVLLRSFLKVKNWSLFLAFKAFADTGYLLCLFLIWLPRVNVLVFHSRGVCQTVAYLSYVFYFLSSWSVAGLTLERYLTLYYPSMTEKYCTRKGTIIFIIIQTLVALAAYNFATWTNQVGRINDLPVCMPVPAFFHVLTVINIINQVIAFFLPLLIVFCLNACIIFKIWMFSKLFRKCSKQDPDSTNAIARLRNSSSIFQASLSQSGRVRFTFYKSSRAAQGGCNCNICIEEQIEASGKKPKDGFQRYKSRRNISRFQSSRLLISLSLLFILCGAPTQVFQFRSNLSFYSNEIFRASKTYRNMQELCQLMSFLNFSMVFIVLIFSSDSFRTALFRMMLRCKQGRKKVKVLDDSG